MNFYADSKTSWPELVGTSADEAKIYILAEQPGFTVHILPYGSMVTADFRSDRVTIFYDHDHNVSCTPHVG